MGVACAVRLKRWPAFLPAVLPLCCQIYQFLEAIHQIHHSVDSAHQYEHSLHPNTHSVDGAHQYVYTVHPNCYSVDGTVQDLQHFQSIMHQTRQIRRPGLPLRRSGRLVLKGRPPGGRCWTEEIAGPAGYDCIVGRVWLCQKRLL